MGALISEVERAHPTFRLQILAGRELADFEQEEVDAAVRL
jgi:DNA-binding transcriptional LysR family regulator